MRIPLRNSVSTLGAVAAAALTLSLAAPATADAATPARGAQAVRAQATVVVPNVVGDDVNTAFNVLQADGLYFYSVQYNDHLCTYNNNEVIKQNPAAGSTVAAPSTVTVTVAVQPAGCL